MLVGITLTGMVWSHDCILQGAVASWFILRHLQLDHAAEIFEKNWRGDAAVVRRFCLALWGHGVSNVFRTCLASSRACPWQSLQVKQFTSNFAEACLETKFVGRDANHRPCVAESEVLAAFETASSREKGTVITLWTKVWIVWSNNGHGVKVSSYIAHPKRWHTWLKRHGHIVSWSAVCRGPS